MTASILIADDDSISRKVLRRLLEQDGYEVRAASDGREALELFAEETCDVVLLDILMPGLDGISVLERLKGTSEGEHIPVIMISAIDDTESVVRCIEIGADDYLTKPFNPVILRARINAGLSKKRLHDLERACARRLLAFSPGARRRRRARLYRRRPAAWRCEQRGHRHVHRPPGLHCVRGGSRQSS